MSRSEPTPPTDAEIVALYASGSLVRDIARSQHVGTARVTRALREAGVDTTEAAKRAVAHRSSVAYVKHSRWHRPPETTIAYMAGLIDGEGCITRASRGRWYLVVSQLAKTGLCEWLVEATGVGSTYADGRDRPMGRWMVMRQLEVVDVLQAALPYLRVKRDQAEEALSAIASLYQLADPGEPNPRLRRIA